jgi:predicted kinase
MLLMVGLPGAGKTTRANELAAAHRALRLTPDEWMIPLFGESMAGGKRFALEGRLISVALQALWLGTSVVLDYGLWGRDERSALRWLARSAGAVCRVVYLPVDRDVQLARIAFRQENAPHQTFPMSEADVDQWRGQFQAPDAAELGGGEIPGPPAGWPGWPEWAVDHWPSLTIARQLSNSSETLQTTLTPRAPITGRRSPPPWRTASGVPPSRCPAPRRWTRAVSPS